MVDESIDHFNGLYSRRPSDVRSFHAHARAKKCVSLVSMNEREFHRVLFESSTHLFSEFRIGLLLR